MRGAHGLAVRVITSYCQAFKAEMVPDAQYLSQIVTKRNDYAYRHLPMPEVMLRRFFVVVVKLHTALHAEILAKEHLIP